MCDTGPPTTITPTGHDGLDSHSPQIRQKESVTSNRKENKTYRKLEWEPEALASGSGPRGEAFVDPSQ